MALNFEPQVTVLIPTVRPDGASRVIRELKHDDTYNNFIVMMELDRDRRGCPLTLKKLVNQSKTELVMFLGDDVIPMPGLIRYAVDQLYKFRGFWGLVALNDQYHDGYELATHWLASKQLLPLLDGEFFFTGYKHCFCDQELTIRCKKIRRYLFAPKAKLIHKHPMVENRPLTGEYKWAYSPEIYKHDQLLFQKRLKNDWQ